MKNNRSFIICFFTILAACFLVYPYDGRSQAISETADTIKLNGIHLAELIDYIKEHSFSMEDYLQKKGYYKNVNSKESYFQNDSSQSWVYLTVTENNHLPKSIADLKQEYVVIKSKNSTFKAALEKIIYDLKNDDNFGVDIDYYKDEYNFYSIKKDFNIKILSNTEYNLIAVY